MKALHLHCHCGSRILTRDVVERSWYVRVYGPNFMYVKYRCSHCRRVGEKLIEQERWDDSILREIPHEPPPKNAATSKPSARLPWKSNSRSTLRWMIREC